MNKKTVRIQNDGDASYNTKITDVATGLPLENVYSVQISIDAGEKYPTATIMMHLPAVDVIVDAELKHMCPYCGQRSYAYDASI